MKNEKLVLLGLFAFILLFGCTEYRYTHIIQEDGSSELKLEVDYTKLIEANAEEEGKTFTAKLLEFEEERIKECEKVEEDIGCEVNNGKIILTKTLEPGEYYSFEAKEEVPDYVYTLKIMKIENLNPEENLFGITEYELNDNTSEQEKIKLITGKEMGAKIEYMVIMPGEIVETNWEDNVEINGSSATFDLLEYGNNPGEIIVKSKKKNEFYSYLVVLLAIAVFLGIIYLLFLKKSGKPEKPKRKKRKK